MRNRGLFAFWAVVAWIAPAAAAGAMGWHGIWGGGNAFVDLLIPIPVAGGVLHVPSFVIVSAILLTQPWSWRISGYVRGVLLGGALVGLAMMVDVTQVYLSVTTDAGLGRVPWQQNALGLFLFTDCLLAQLVLAGFDGRWPDGAKEWGVSFAVVIALPAAFAAAWIAADPRQRTPIMYVASQPGPGRTDASYLYYTRLPIGGDAFRKAVETEARLRDPRNSAYAEDEDVALHFFDSLDAARNRRLDEAKQTLCLYEDGTPSAWHPGRADCFSAHDSFSDRIQKAFAAQDKALHVDVRAHLARRDACAGRKPPATAPGADGNDATRTCTDLGRRRELLLKQFAAEPAIVDLLQAAR